MPGEEHVISVVREWVEKAENDLKNAAHTLKMGEDCPANTVVLREVSLFYPISDEVPS